MAYEGSLLPGSSLKHALDKDPNTKAEFKDTTAKFFFGGTVRWATVAIETNVSVQIKTLTGEACADVSGEYRCEETSGFEVSAGTNFAIATLVVTTGPTNGKHWRWG